MCLICVGPSGFVARVWVGCCLCCECMVVNDLWCLFCEPVCILVCYAVCAVCSCVFCAVLSVICASRLFSVCCVLSVLCVLCMCHVWYWVLHCLLSTLFCVLFSVWRATCDVCGGDLRVVCVD